MSTSANEGQKTSGEARMFHGGAGGSWPPTMTVQCDRVARTYARFGKCCCGRRAVLLLCRWTTQSRCGSGGPRVRGWPLDLCTTEFVELGVRAWRAIAGARAKRSGGGQHARTHRAAPHRPRGHALAGARTQGIPYERGVNGRVVDRSSSGGPNENKKCVVRSGRLRCTDQVLDEIGKKIWSQLHP